MIVVDCGSNKILTLTPNLTSQLTPNDYLETES